MFLPDEKKQKLPFEEKKEIDIEDLFRCNHFYGIIYNENDIYEEGIIYDNYGKAILEGIIVEEKKLEFMKRYVSSPGISEPLLYTFIKKDGIWFGTYRDDTGKNTGACWAIGEFIPKLFLEVENVKGFITF